MPASAPYTSELAELLAPGVLERFLRYVRIDTQSARDGNGTPSTPGQFELARLLVAELHDAGLSDAAVDEHCYVTATLEPSQAVPGAPTIGLLAHIDTSPDAPGAGVEPLVHRGYGGGVIELPREGTRLDPEAMPELAPKNGHDIVSSSGDTLLGADDKAGMAEIMAAVAHLAAHPELPRSRIRVAFTPDEEIGQGPKLFDIGAFGALCAYTLDGSDLGFVEHESFSAIEAIVGIEGIDVHAGHATGKLVNALRFAAQMVAALPSDRLTPETTSGRDGFIHPYSIAGTPKHAEIRLILREFDEQLLEAEVALLKRVVDEVTAPEPRVRADVKLTEQYRNMRTYVEAAPFVLQAAEQAIRAEGIEPIHRPIRGGTDGSQLSARGLPTPNIFTGGNEYHSNREWASVHDMAAAAATVVRLAEVWAGHDGSDNGR